MTAEKMTVADAVELMGTGTSRITLAVGTQVDVDVRAGIPSFTVVGAGLGVQREFRERLRAGLINAGFEFPAKRITVAIAPLTRRRNVRELELAVAAALLVASGQLREEHLPGRDLIGEVQLDGSVRAAAGCHEPPVRRLTELAVSTEGGPRRTYEFASFVRIRAQSELEARAIAERLEGACGPLSLDDSPPYVEVDEPGARLRAAS